jgi:hypothetical protein
LGERLNGIQEVARSIRVSSTSKLDPISVPRPRRATHTFPRWSAAVP